MADDAQSIRSINWRELFPFIHLFRAFRVAIHPSKLVLGFALLFLIYVGGRVLDAAWPATSLASYSEIDQYTIYLWAHEHPQSFDDLRARQLEENASSYADKLVAVGILNEKKDAIEPARRGEYFHRLESHVVGRRNEEFNKIENARDLRLKDVKGTDDERQLAQRRIRDEYDTQIRTTQIEALKAIEQLRTEKPRHLFDAFFDYEIRQFDGAIESALAWNWLGGISIGSGGQLPAADHLSSPGVVACVANLAVVGPGWLLRYHLIYFILFASWFLLLWAIFGGAIARIAGVHVARDEKISVRQALRFSTSKLLSFVFAPVIPLIIILVAGVIIALGGLLWYIPVIGPIVGGAIFILALIAGFIITLVGVGTVGGFNLMYPTIAVEGSDSFDAISRSFSYIFARPWRMIFYTALSLVYGALCFLFVRYFVYVMLSVTHFFASWFLFDKTKPGHYWPEIWPSVNDVDLAYRINFQALAWSEAVSAFLIACWVYVVLAFLAAFVVSFYFSANTIIYYLMRREVDATELDDVYVEDTDEDFAEIAVAATVATTTPEPPPPAVPTTT